MTEELTDDLIMALIKTDKRLIGAKCIFEEPDPGKWLNIDLEAPEFPAEKFIFGTYVGKRSSSIALDIVSERKVTMQTRQGSFRLARIDLDPYAIHSNPDGSIIRGPHLHVATIKHSDRVAYGLASQSYISGLSSGTKITEAFARFADYCHIEKRLRIDWKLEV